MVVRVSDEPFITGDAGFWRKDLLGPAWVQIIRPSSTRAFWDAPLDPGIKSFIRIALKMAPQEVTYGTVYASPLGDGPVSEGEWHYDLGEYREDGAMRYVGTWASDGYPLQNAFKISESVTIQPPNDYVIEFSEGTDYHRRLAVPARPWERGVYISLALYREEEPANLDCPKLAPLRTRGPRSRQAVQHRPVKRTIY